jgi:GntR family transcriptional regulator
MYRQIADDLGRQIESGELPPGNRLPAELELRARYDASRNTVRDAVRWLITRGLVETRPGQGTFVTAEIVPFVTALTPSLEIGFGGEDGTYVMEVTAKRRIPEARIPRVEIQQAADTGAVELQLARDAMVISRHQQRYIDETPWSLQTSFYPRTLDERGAERLSVANDIAQGAVAYIEETLSIKLMGWRDKITVRAPTRWRRPFSSCPTMVVWPSSRPGEQDSTRTAAPSCSRSARSRPTETSSSSTSGRSRPKSSTPLRQVKTTRARLTYHRLIPSEALTTLFSANLHDSVGSGSELSTPAQ